MGALLDPLLGDYLWRISTRSARLFDVLCEHPYGLTSIELMDRVWADDPDGGPDNQKIISVMAHRFNVLARRAGLGLRINAQVSSTGRRARRGSGGAGTRFVIWVTKPRGR